MANPFHQDFPAHEDDIPGWLRRARLELGVREGKSDARIVQYHQYTGLRAKSSSVAWCASFVAWALEQEGIRSTRSAAAASYKDFGRPSDPVPGAIILFSKHDPDAKGSGHVGLVNALPDGEWIEVLSGNCANQVKLKKYRLDAAVAIRWPLNP